MSLFIKLYLFVELHLKLTQGLHLKLTHPNEPDYGVDLHENLTQYLH